MTKTTDFSENYFEARTRFLQAALDYELQVITIEHPLSGQFPEPIAVDIVQLGAQNATNVVFVVSGVHGTELTAGSGAQLALLHVQATTPIDNTRVVYIHAANPYGAAVLSRTDENNVDVNRNILSDFTDLPENCEYDALHNALCPQKWTGSMRQAADEKLADFVAKNGLKALTQNVLRGQYSHPNGLFYGGTSRSWVVSTLVEILATFSAGAPKAAIIDLHTGVGPKGFAERIRLDRPRIPGAEWEKIGNCVCDLIEELDLETPPIKIILEFGTHDFFQVLTSLRADNWLRHYGDPTSSQGLQIKEQLRGALFIHENEWMQSVVSQTQECLGAVVRELSSPICAPTHEDKAVTNFGAALSTASKSGDAYKALDALVVATIGSKLFTVMEVTGAAKIGRRSFSNAPDDYPLDSEILLLDNHWYRTTIEQRQCYIANDFEEICEAFSDHKLISSLGCGSIFNMPVIVDGALVATVNMLDAPGFFTTERVEKIQHLLREPARAVLRTEARLAMLHRQ